MSEYYSKQIEIKFLLAIHAHFIHNIKEWLKRQPRKVKVFRTEKEWTKLHGIMDFGIQEDTKKEIMEFDWTIIAVGYVKSIMGVQSIPNDIHAIMASYLYPGSTPYVLFRCGSYKKGIIHQGYKYHPYQTHTPMTSDDDDNNNDNDNDNE